MIISAAGPGSPASTRSTPAALIPLPTVACALISNSPDEECGLSRGAVCEFIVALDGAVIGAFTGEMFGMGVGAALGWLAVRSRDQQRELRALRQALAAVEVRLRALAGSVAPPLASDAGHGGRGQDSRGRCTRRGARRRGRGRSGRCTGGRRGARYGRIRGRSRRLPGHRRARRRADCKPCSAALGCATASWRCGWAQRRARIAPPRPARADQALAVRRQHDRQGRGRDPLHRPRVPRQVRQRDTCRYRSRCAWR